MTAILDTSVLISALQPDHEFHSWSQEQIIVAKLEGPLLICDVAYSEFSVAMKTREETDQALSVLDLERPRASDRALFQAGKAFLAYKRRGGTKENVLPDYLIGAQAHDLKAKLITTNAKDFSFFDGLEILHP